MGDVLTDEKIKGAVRQTYGDIARRFVGEPAPEAVQQRSRSSCCGPAEVSADRATQASCCGASKAAEATAAARFYPVEELAALPDSVTDASLGCGNPLAIAELKPGEVVLDLGSGGGIDCFLAATKVGPEGRVIGLDMTPEMIKLAQRNAKKMKASNVEFRFGEMEDIPLPDESVNVIISNCVINLSPDKNAVFHEAYRVLRPGGRMSVSDMVVDGDLPQAIRENLNSWAQCIAGALDESDYLAAIRSAGFEQVEVVSRAHVELDEANEWEAVQALVGGAEGDSARMKEAQTLLEASGLSPRDLANKVASIKVKAYKQA
jgi:arsenite methyltransferase